MPTGRPPSCDTPMRPDVDPVERERRRRRVELDDQHFPGVADPRARQRHASRRDFDQHRVVLRWCRQARGPEVSTRFAVAGTNRLA